MSVFGLLFLVTYAAMGFVVGSVCHAVRVIKVKSVPAANVPARSVSRSLLGDFLLWPLAICVLAMRIAGVGIRHATRAAGIDKHLVDL